MPDPAAAGLKFRLRRKKRGKSCFVLHTFTFSSGTRRVAWAARRDSGRKFGTDFPVRQLGRGRDGRRRRVIRIADHVGLDRISL